MHQIDKKNFGSFISQLRREKGMTQKELAEKLFISDKAVSKWETGVSIPDTALLVPLSEILGVSVTELLMCRRMDGDELSQEIVEDAVKTAVTYSAKAERAWNSKGIWIYIYLCALLIGVLCLWLGYKIGVSPMSVYTVTLISAIFGAYFCFIIKTRLPQYYDDNKISGVYDSAFRMNVPGLYFNNSNWPYIILVGRIWSCGSLAVYPLINLMASRFMPVFWERAEQYVCLVIVLGGLAVPMYIVGKKYE